MSETTSNPAGRRQHVMTVDVARGVFAIAVMAYHYYYMTGMFQVERVAYYAVYGFFVISGFALYVSSQDRLHTASDIQRYVSSRFLRIAPLYYLAMILHVWLVGPESAQGYKFLWNLTLMFGFANPGSASLLMGGWSLGIEIVFYLLLPFIVWAGLSARSLALLALVGTCLSLSFVNYTLQGHLHFDAGLWSAYTQPAAFVGYFLSGCAIGAAFTARPQKSLILPALVIVTALLPFLIVRVSNPLQLLQGFTGALLAACTIALVAAVAYLPEPAKRWGTAAKLIGGMSYPIYLLHPLSYLAVEKIGVLSTGPKLVAAITLTATISYIVHQYLELPVRRLRSRLFPQPG